MHYFHTRHQLSHILASTHIDNIDRSYHRNSQTHWLRSLTKKIKVVLREPEMTNLTSMTWRGLSVGSFRHKGCNRNFQSLSNKFNSYSKPDSSSYYPEVNGETFTERIAPEIRTFSLIHLNDMVLIFFIEVTKHEKRTGLWAIHCSANKKRRDKALNKRVFCNSVWRKCQVSPVLPLLVTLALLTSPRSLPVLHHHQWPLARLGHTLTWATY